MAKDHRKTLSPSNFDESCRYRTSKSSHLLIAMVLTAMAAGMGWGIRGQFGHESGAMIAGVLASLTLMLLFVPWTSSLKAARAAAMMTVAIGIGGSMTYGQTIGLTHDSDLVNNWEALRWGMLGLFTKGAIWIGFGGAFLGMGLGGKRYRSLELALLMPALLGLMFVGESLLNSPFDPDKKLLPLIYFSDSWYFEPDKAIKPRPEIWGGLLLALVTLIFYLRVFRKDRLAARMALIGFIAGGLGFSGGQCLQAFHSWNPAVFQAGGLLGAYADFFQFLNWWNMMEISFGMIFGAVLAFGLWFNQHLIAIDQVEQKVTLSPTLETFLLVVHFTLLLNAEFLEQPGWGMSLSLYTEYGPLMSIIPLIGIAGGRLWPYMMLLPVVAAPICGKVIRYICFEQQRLLPEFGWLIYVAIPLAILITVSCWLICRSSQGQSSRSFAAITLLTTTWLYFVLNVAFFNFAWPSEEWTGRTPSQIIFGVFTIVLTLAAIAYGLKSNPGRSKDFDS